MRDLAFAGVSGDSCLGCESERSHATLLCFLFDLVFVLGNAKPCHVHIALKNNVSERFLQVKGHHQV